MTLEEKFYNSKISTNIFRREESISCTKIADEFAVDFAEWFWYHGTKYWRGERREYLEMSEILKIYKKEKGL
jgi:hypothetical protein